MEGDNRGLVRAGKTLRREVKCPARREKQSEGVLRTSDRSPTGRLVEIRPDKQRLGLKGGAGDQLPLRIGDAGVQRVLETVGAGACA